MEIIRRAWKKLGMRILNDILIHSIMTENPFFTKGQKERSTD